MIGANPYVSRAQALRLWSGANTEVACTLAENLTLLAERSKQDQIIGRMRTLAGHSEGRMVGSLEKQFVALGKHVASVARSLGGVVLEADRPHFTPNETLRLRAILDGSRPRDWATDNLTPVYAASYDEMLSAVVDALSRHIEDLPQRDKIAAKIIADGGKRVGLVDITGDTRTALFRMLEVMKETGEGPRAAYKYIEEFVPEGRFVNAGSRYRATMIARTELLHAQRTASLQMYRSMSQVNSVVMYDGDSDEECAARDGAIVDIEDAEFEMNSTHPNCVLAFAPASI